MPREPRHGAVVEPTEQGRLAAAVVPQEAVPAAAHQLERLPAAPCGLAVLFDQLLAAVRVRGELIGHL